MDSSLFRRFWLHYMKIDFVERTLLSSIWPSIHFRKRSRLYHFNELKCNLCFVINIWQKFKSYSEQFQFSNLNHNVAKGDISLELTQRNYNYRFMKEIIFFNCYLAAQQPTLGCCWGGSLTKPMLMTAFATYPTRRSPGAQ